VLEGNLDDFSLPDILRLLASTSKTGRLAIQQEDAAGRVDLADGQVREASGDAYHLAIARRLLGAGLVTADDLSAVLRGRDRLPTDLELARELADSDRMESGTLAEVVREQTVDAVFDLLRWKQGTFRFDGHALEGQDGQALELAVPVDDVLAEATSRLESWPSVEERTGDGGAVVTISRPPGERAEVSLSPDGWSLLSFVDGRRTVTELAHLSGQGEFRTRRTLVALLDEGVITIAESGGPGQVERLLADHDRLAALEAELGGALTRPRPSRSTADGVLPAGSASGSAAAAPMIAPPAAPSSSPTPAAPAVAEASASEAPDDVPERPRPARVTMADQARPGPVTVRPEGVAAAGEDEPTDGPSHPPHGGRLRTDPTVDADLVRRLIDGVESL
jgi:hypothetical protein